jgi:serine/threonine protein kinase
MDPLTSDPNAPPLAVPVSGESAPGGTTAPRGDAAPPAPFLGAPQRADEIGRLGPYRVLGVLGRGGMGVVYHARDTRLDRAVALKVLLPELSADPPSRARFLREARAQANVEHDHIIPIHDATEADGIAYLLRSRSRLASA